MGEQAEPPRHTRLPGRLRTVGVIALTVAILLACVRQAPLPVLDHAPASALSLSILFLDNTLVSDTVVYLTVNVVSGGHAVTLSTNQRLTCNGVRLSEPSQYGGLVAKVERQPPGGSYVFAYRDEQGHTTTFSVPAIARLALIAPAPGATVAIPQRVALVPTPSAISPGTRTPDLAHAPLPVRYTVPSLPPNAVATVSMDAECATAQSFFGCGRVEGPKSEPVTGTYSISDASVTYTYGFESFVPGPGYIAATLQVSWRPVTAFQLVTLSYTSHAESPVIWTATVPEGRPARAVWMSRERMFDLSTAIVEG